MRERVDGRHPQERARVGLCVACVHARRLVSARGSVFYRCGRAADDAAYRDYPALPVEACEGYAEVETESKQSGPDTAGSKIDRPPRRV